MKARIFSLFLLFLMLFEALPLPLFAQSAQNPADDPQSVAEGIIAWKKNALGADPDEPLINAALLAQAGTTAGDWYPIALGRLGIEDNQIGYLGVIADTVAKRYARAEKLDRAKATEWHRIALAMLACGGNPRKAGLSADIDLIADGTYNRADASSGGLLGKQGINGFIWGLIALDSLFYEVPEDAYYTRDDIILNLLNRQLDDGGWALSGDRADPDITAMTLQALAPYVNSEKVYSFERKTGEMRTLTVRRAVSDALTCLSNAQLPSGDFESWNTQNVESTAQVIIALCSLGIDPFTDSRFIKDGHTAYDGLLRYRNADGGFVHSFHFDPDNPTALPDTSNSMAGEQALCALAALIRYQKGLRRLYDFRPEMSEEEKKTIVWVDNAISSLSFSSAKSEIEAVYKSYLAIPASDRSYVGSYDRLSELLLAAGIAFAEEEIHYNSGDAGLITPMQEFTERDIAAVRALPEKVTMAEKAEILRLFFKIENCFDFEEKEKLRQCLGKAKRDLDALEAEIEAIKAEIREKLYPFDKIGLGDRAVIYDLYERFTALSDYDRSLFEESDVEGLLKSKTRVDNLHLALVLSLSLGGAALLLALFLVYRIRWRKKRKALRAMPESDE